MTRSLLGLPRDQSSHGLAVIHENIDPIALGLMAYILEGNLEVKCVDAFPFLEKAVKGNQSGLGRNLLVDLPGTRDHLFSGVGFYPRTA